MSPSVHHVFVYGSLLRGEPAHGLLRGHPCLGTRETESPWELHDLGAYPAAVPGGTASLEGELYEVDQPTLDALDAFEGCPDLFARTRARLADGREAWIYTLAPEVQEDARLGPSTRCIGGSWKTHLAHRVRGTL